MDTPLTTALHRTGRRIQGDPHSIRIRLTMLLLLLLLSCFSRVQLCETPWAAAYQAPPFMGFSRQEYWSGLPLPSPLNINLSQPFLVRVICLNQRRLKIE